MLRVARRWSPGLTHSKLVTGDAVARRKTGVRVVAPVKTDDSILSLSCSFLRMCAGSRNGVGMPSGVSRRSGRGRIVAAMDKAEAALDSTEMTGLKGEAYNDTPSSAWGMSSFHSNMNKATKWMAAILAILVVLWRHDEHAMWFAVGSVVNGGVCKLLKQLFKESRPQTAAGIKSDPGMPSSHAQGLAFLGTYAAAALLSWLGLNAWTILGATGLTCAWMYGSWLRISEGLHTVPQVLVGNALGVTTALGWFFLWKAVVGSAVHSSEVLRIVLIVAFAAAALVCYFISFKNWKLGEM